MNDDNEINPIKAWVKFNEDFTATEQKRAIESIHGNTWMQEMSYDELEHWYFQAIARKDSLEISITLFLYGFKEEFSKNENWYDDLVGERNEKRIIMSNVTLKLIEEAQNVCMEHERLGGIPYLTLEKAIDEVILKRQELKLASEQDEQMNVVVSSVVTTNR